MADSSPSPVEVWCWEPGNDAGHIALSVRGQLYHFGADPSKATERNQARVARSNEEFGGSSLYGGWAGITVLRSSEEEPEFRWLQWTRVYRKKRGVPFAHIFRIECSSVQADSVERQLRSQVEDRPEYCIFADPGSDNCVTTSLGIAARAGILPVIDFVTTEEELERYGIAHGAVLRKLRSMGYDGLRISWPHVAIAKLLNLVDQDKGSALAHAKRSLRILYEEGTSQDQ